MSIPTPGSWIKPSSDTSSKVEPPKPREFVRKPHLMQRPFKDNSALQALRDSLPQNKQQNHKGGQTPKLPKGTKPNPQKRRRAGRTGTTSTK